MKYSQKALYNKYKQARAKAQSKGAILKREYSEEEFSNIYSATKNALVNTKGKAQNITRSVVQDQTVNSREQLQKLKLLAAGDTEQLDEIKKLEKRNIKQDDTAISKYYSEQHLYWGDQPTTRYFDESGKETLKLANYRYYTEAQAYFAALISAGYTKEEVEEAYGYSK